MFEIAVNDNIRLFPNNPLVLIAGPCVIESEDHALFMAETLKKLAQQFRIPFIFKSSFLKANRSSIHSFVGPGPESGLGILQKVQTELGLAVISDVHSVEQAELAGSILDIIQIPAFLSRQTELLVAAGMTGKPINVKKGQFLAPSDVKNIIEKVQSTGNRKILITERGVTFGYNNLVVDMRSLEIMKSFEAAVVFDATHSVQLPGGMGSSSGGERRFVAPLARAATAIGINALFLEVHDNPDTAKCDGPNMISI
ncbi:MAG: 3-deoxy-8-phosphooctulonate synthase, partial [Syntrophorhabdus aromaticivorans]|nr:3-deoxy-8-phosphooctulonate synthase [Syntrophorhabdus aromaticivorans]